MIHFQQKIATPVSGLAISGLKEKIAVFAQCCGDGAAGIRIIFMAPEPDGSGSKPDYQKCHKL
jgi:hypothetical protein